jgi:hypothetical protein
VVFGHGRALWLWGGNKISGEGRQKLEGAGRRWLTPVILAIQEAEIRRVTVRSQPGQIIRETLAQKPLHKNRAGEMAQGESPEFKPKYRKNKNKKKQLGSFSEGSCASEAGRFLSSHRDSPDKRPGSD